MTETVSNGVGIISAIVAIVAVIYQRSAFSREISKDRADTASQMAVMKAEIDHSKEAISRAFGCIEVVQKDIAPIQQTIAKIQSGIEYLVRGMDELKNKEK